MALPTNVKITPMSYQVLARKYRPKNFKTLVGQEHVVRALTHALAQQRLHHAYLFTGTRGVGKTTLSRILAKSLNCEIGITAEPCGACDACLAIDAGRFVDYIEMDAASNRGVDEMAQLLEQAIYAPSNARFKVYMIDEVHMLTNHAFNAMLKTLEEPPEHVKFILATTDPQKIPVTVLSRCLQFNLKQMPQPAIVGHLEHILAEENITFELPALRLLAQGAQGSMRDALSLTDQAIAYAAGNVSLEAVQGMLGALDQTYLIQIIDALAAQDGVALLAVADSIAARSLSYKCALQDLAVLLHRISIAQLAPDAIALDLPEQSDILRLATALDAEHIQLLYQIAVHGRNELSLAPDEYAGFSMTLLRMLAFRPIASEAVELAPASKTAPTPKKTAPMPAAPVNATNNESRATKTSPALAALEALKDKRTTAPKSLPSSDSAPPQNIKASPNTPPTPSFTWDGDWPKLSASLPLRGVALQLAQQSELLRYDVATSATTITLRVPLETLLASSSTEKLSNALTEHFGVTVKVATEIGAVQQTAHTVALENRAQQQSAAEGAIKDDAFVQGLIRELGATIVPGSIKPLN
jgi:DNA polymerase-3 subunit gamma/tau